LYTAFGILLASECHDDDSDGSLTITIIIVIVRDPSLSSLLGLGTGRFGWVLARSATRPVPLGFEEFQPVVNSNFSISVGYRVERVEDFSGGLVGLVERVEYFFSQPYTFFSFVFFSANKQIFSQQTNTTICACLRFFSQQTNTTILANKHHNLGEKVETKRKKRNRKGRKRKSRIVSGVLAWTKETEESPLFCSSSRFSFEPRSVRVSVCERKSASENKWRLARETSESETVRDEDRDRAQREAIQARGRRE
jgi:hypothetical protein